MSSVLSVLMEIRDLLALQLPEKKKTSRKEPRRPKTDGKAKPKPRPKWSPSKYPFETWKVNETKRYPIAEKKHVTNRIVHVNGLMKRRDHLPNHLRSKTVMENGKLWIRVWRDE